MCNPKLIDLIARERESASSPGTKNVSVRIDHLKKAKLGVNKYDNFNWIEELTILWKHNIQLILEFDTVNYKPFFSLHALI